MPNGRTGYAQAMTTDPVLNLDATESSTLTELLAAYADAGFDGSFSAYEGAQLECHECGARFAASEVEMASLRRLEGASDPADMVAVVALTCPRCSAKGTAVLGFGPAAAPEDGDVLGALRDRRGNDELPGNSAPGEATGDEANA
ncbi:MAG: hypothetical protein JWM12_346 [Ilumatobacteraceae bacterium]|nr:hypothetical protein [Ilumatobacteraceae bacterium]